MELKKYYLAAFLLFVSQALSAQTQDISSNAVKVHSGDKQRIVQTQRQAAHDDKPQTTNNEVSQTNEPPSKNITLSIRKLLSEYKYSELNDVLDQYLVSTEHDISKEQDLMTAYWAFEINDDKLPDLLNSWANTTPDNYQPYLARAYYYLGKGWDARGHKWSKDTKQEQFDKMKAYFAKASQDINVVLKKNDRALPAYYVLIGILQSSGDINTINKVLKLALGKFPNSYYLRDSYLDAVTPRWGGNYDLMQQVVDEAKTHIDQNPRLGILQGNIYDDMAEMKMLNGESAEADKLYTMAISFGDNGLFYYHRGRNNYYRHDYQKALADFNKIIDTYTENSDYYYWRAQAYFALEKNLLGEKDLLKADQLNPGDKRIVKQRKWIAGQLENIARLQHFHHELDKSIATWNRALALDADNPDLHYLRAITFIDNNQLDEAYKDLQLAIENKPYETDFYQAMSTFLIKRKDWDDLMVYSNKFIHAYPKDPAGYMWKTSAYAGKGDLKKAMQSAKIAADLGNPIAKMTYEDLAKYLAKQVK